MKTVHLVGGGMVACMREMPPAVWPEGHYWSSEWEDVTCPDCLAGKDYPITYILDLNGPSITCKRCNRTSFNREDFNNRYCGFCHVFHEDIWPPARKWWVEHPDKASLWSTPK